MTSLILTVVVNLDRERKGVYRRSDTSREFTIVPRPASVNVYIGGQNVGSMVVMRVT